MNCYRAIMVVGCLLITGSVQAQNSLCNTWEKLMAHRSENFEAIVGPKLRMEGRESIFQSTITFDSDWNEVTLRSHPDYRARHFEIKKKGLADQNVAYLWLNEQLSKLAACLPDYVFYKTPSAFDKYYILSPETKSERHSIAMIGYRKADNGTYDIYLYLERFYEILPDEAIQATIKPAAPPKPAPGAGDYQIGNASIKKQDFSRKLLQLASLSKSSFGSIRGQELKGKVFTTYRTNYILDGADSLYLTQIPSGMVYNAHFTAPDAFIASIKAFDQLQKLVSTTLPASFTTRGVITDELGKRITYINRTDRQVITIELPEETPDLVLKVSSPSPLPD